MTALEIVLLLIGIICVAVSFIFFMRFDGPENVQSVNVSLSDKQKEAIKGQISSVFKEQTDELTRNVEVNTKDALEHLSNEKIKELSEYSDTVLAEINKNHTEVMFLYDMLNEKSKEVHNNIRDLNLAAEAVQEAMTQQNEAISKKTEAEAAENAVKEEQDAKESKPKTTKRTTASKTTASKAAAKSTAVTRKRTTKPKSADADDVKENVSQSESIEKPVSGTVQETVEKEAQVDNEKQEKPVSNENKKEAVLSLYNDGRSVVEIAKTLGIGVGEVKLVLDLFKGIK
ncbi:putative uncharacterized protein [Firmicutes bacterium CAG:882]|jgi:hypothetical protein|nr:putative uncharacterized protein [Firmicutes bacterium CAG:882]